MLINLLLNIFYSTVFRMSQTKQIEAIFQVSEVLLKAFQQIHQITGDFIKSNKQKKHQKQEAPKAPQIEEKKEKKKQKQERPKQPEGEKQKRDEPVKVKVVEEREPKKEQLEKKKEKKKNHPQKPKYPLSGYFRFNSANLDKIKSEYPELAQKELVSISSMLWNKLSEEEKRPYEQAFEREKKAYNIAIEKFYNNHPEERPKSGPHHKQQ